MERETRTLIFYKDIVPMGRQDNLNAIHQYPTLRMECDFHCLPHMVTFEDKVVLSMVILLKDAYGNHRIHVTLLFTRSLTEEELIYRTFDVTTVDLEEDEIQATLPYLKLDWLVDCQSLIEVFETLKID
jgi:hypothetical protein